MAPAGPVAVADVVAPALTVEQAVMEVAAATAVVAAVKVEVEAREDGQAQAPGVDRGRLSACLLNPQN